MLTSWPRPCLAHLHVTSRDMTRSRGGSSYSKRSLAVDALEFVAINLAISASILHCGSIYHAFLLWYSKKISLQIQHLPVNWSWAGKCDRLFLSARSPKQHVTRSKWPCRANRGGSICVNKWLFSLLTEVRFSQIQCCFTLKFCSEHNDSAGRALQHLFRRRSLEQLFPGNLWEKW